MFIVTRIWISISDLDLNSIIESHHENLENLVNFIIVIINTTKQSARRAAPIHYVPKDFYYN